MGDFVDTYIVLTTVNVPTLLEDYAKNFFRFGRNNVGFIVIGDLATPHDKVEKVVRNVKEQGFEAYYFDVPAQKKWLRKFPDLGKVIPYKSDNRRNIGFLVAAERGAETIISIDDDNYVVEDDDYYSHHSIVGKTAELPTVSSSNKWYNPCALLRTNNGMGIYPRGYPFYKRFKEKHKFAVTNGHVVMNMGLWINDPDADAITNLSQPTKIIEMNNKYETVMLAPGTFSPINTQNTAFHRDVLPCYYYVLMGAHIRGLKIDRYGDIWSGFFAKKVIDQANDRVTIGKPLTNHKRNIHNLFTDLKNELWGMILTEKLVPWIENLQLSGKSYFNAYAEIAENLKVFKETFQENSIKKYLGKTANAMKTWLDACNKIL